MDFWQSYWDKEDEYCSCAACNPDLLCTCKHRAGVHDFLKGPYKCKEKDCSCNKFVRSQSIKDGRGK